MSRVLAVDQMGSTHTLQMSPVALLGYSSQGGGSLIHFIIFLQGENYRPLVTVTGNFPMSFETLKDKFQRISNGIGKEQGGIISN